LAKKILRRKMAALLPVARELEFVLPTDLHPTILAYLEPQQIEELDPNPNWPEINKLQAEKGIGKYLFLERYFAAVQKAGWKDVYSRVVKLLIETAKSEDYRTDNVWTEFSRTYQVMNHARLDAVSLPTLEALARKIEAVSIERFAKYMSVSASELGLEAIYGDPASWNLLPCEGFSLPGSIVPLCVVPNESIPSDGLVRLFEFLCSQGQPVEWLQLNPNCNTILPQFSKGLLAACRQGHTHIVEALKNWPGAPALSADVLTQAFKLAIKNGSAPIVKLLKEEWPASSQVRFSTTEEEGSLNLCEVSDIELFKELMNGSLLEKINLGEWARNYLEYTNNYVRRGCNILGGSLDEIDKTANSRHTIYLLLQNKIREKNEVLTN
jgi:hypothetical protein